MRPTRPLFAMIGPNILKIGPPGTPKTKLARLYLRLWGGLGIAACGERSVGPSFEGMQFVALYAVDHSVVRTGGSSVRLEHPNISCEGRHRECPDLVSCILLFCSVHFKGRRPGTMRLLVAPARSPKMPGLSSHP